MLLCTTIPKARKFTPISQSLGFDGTVVYGQDLSKSIRRSSWFSCLVVFGMSLAVQRQASIHSSWFVSKLWMCCAIQLHPLPGLILRGLALWMFSLLGSPSTSMMDAVALAACDQDAQRWAKNANCMGSPQPKWVFVPVCCVFPLRQINRFPDS